MKSIDIITSHNVTIEYQLAGVMERFLAWLLDLIIVLAWFLVVFTLTVNMFRAASYESAMIVYYIFFVPVFFCYHLVSESFFGGRSIGKLALGIKVVRLNGQNPTIGDCALRWVFRVVDILFSAGALAALFISSGEKSQRLGDMIARTVVIKLNPTYRMTVQDILKIKDTTSHGDILYPQVAQLNDDDMLLIKNAIERVRLYPNPRHRQLIEELTKKVRERLSIEDQPKDKIRFLRQLLEEYIVLTR